MGFDTSVLVSAHHKYPFGIFKFFLYLQRIVLIRIAEALTSIKMASNAWNTAGNVANVLSITENVTTAAALFAAGFAAARSPKSTDLDESWQKIRRIRETLDGIPLAAEQTQPVESAAREACKSIDDLETQYR
jgi:hypothetical protein